MKLLLDQNLSRRLVPELIRVFPGTRHVSGLGLEGADDERIWRFARDHGFVIVSKDADFLHRSIVRGHPPKVIQIRIGNASTDEIGRMLSRNRVTIRAFLRRKDEALLVLC